MEGTPHEPRRGWLKNGSPPGDLSQVRRCGARNMSFNMETWSQGGLRYFVIGDASAADINSLAKLFRTAAS
jgi:hypothetical protein